MASLVDSSGSMISSCEKGTAISGPCQRICTSMSCSHASSTAMRRTSTVSPFPERRDGVRGDTLHPERETDLAFQVVMPAHSLVIRTGIDDRFVVDEVLPS